MRVGSLCAGIGGFDLAARWLGWQTVWHAEIDPYASAVFARHFPAPRNVGDVTRWHPDARAGRVNVITGGIPCQPASLAGKGLGVDDERWLWPEAWRVVRLLRPDYFVLENVPGLLAAGRGFNSILGDLAAGGYDAEWESLSANAVGAPHLRDRLWLVAYPKGEPERAGLRSCGPGGQWWGRLGHEGGPVPNASGRGRTVRGGAQRAAGQPAQLREDVADAESQRLEGAGPRPQREPNGETPRGGRPVGGGGEEFSDAGGQRLEGLVEAGTTEGAVDGPGDGRDSGWWAVEPDVGRVAHGIPSRVDRLTCLGNAIVPEVAYRILRQIAYREGLTV